MGGVYAVWVTILLCKARDVVASVQSSNPASPGAADYDHDGHVEDLGYNLTSIETDSICSSGGMVIGNSGEFTSPNFPENYPNNITCIWKIRSPKDRYTYLFFHEFILEEGYVNSAFNPFAQAECHFDMLYIAEEYLDSDRTEESSSVEAEPRTTQVTWGVYCGEDIPPPRMTERAGSTLVVVFHADMSKTKTGFHASFHTVKQTNRQRELSSRATHNPGTMSDVMDAIWSFGSDESVRALLAIVVFVSAVIAVIATAHCYTERSYCSALSRFRHRTRTSRSVPSMMLTMFGGSSTGTARTPTPPPAYGEVVKTEEDWRAALRRIGETEESMERHRSRPDNIRIVHDLREARNPSPSAEADVHSTNQSQLPLAGGLNDPRGGVIDNILNRTEQRTAVRQSSEDRRGFKFYTTTERTTP